MNKTLIACITLPLVLTACGTSEVIKHPTANGYVVSAQYGALNGSWSRASQEAVEKAKAFCDAKGERYVFITEERTGVVGWSPQESSIVFDCVNQSTKPISIGY